MSSYPTYLVELQLRVAAGEQLGFGQEDVRFEGHAIEARLYAEDAAHGFLPSAGRVVAYHEPAGVRVDSGVALGTEVGTDYDPMLAKMIAHGADRGEALARLESGLGELLVLGPTTNAAYLRALLARPEVRAGEIDTGLIERLGDAVAPPPAAPELAAVALTVLLGQPASDDPWDARDGWRFGAPAWARARLTGPDGDVDVAIQASGTENECRWASDTSRAGISGPSTEDGGGGAGDGAGLSGAFRFDGHTLEVGGESRRVLLRRHGDAVWLVDGAAEPARFEFAAAAGAGGGAAAGGSLEAPMPGVVIEVRSEPGAVVGEGDVLVVLESMKMELSIQSPRDGKIAEVLVGVGDQVDRGQTLIALAAAEEDSK